MNDEFLLDVEESNRKPVQIKLFKVMLVLVCLVGAFFAVSAILCFTKPECTNHIPSLYNMLNSSFSAPFVVTALNTVLSIHGILVMALYAKTHYRSQYASTLQIVSAVLLYILIGVTLFVFPFSYKINYASLLIILGIAVWKLSVLITLKNYYKGHLVDSRKYMILSVTIFIAYVASSIAYIAVKFSYSSELGVLVTEIICGFSILFFLILLVIHVGNSSIEIKKESP